VNANNNPIIQFEHKLRDMIRMQSQRLEALSDSTVYYHIHFKAESSEKMEWEVYARCYALSNNSVTLSGAVLPDVVDAVIRTLVGTVKLQELPALLPPPFAVPTLEETNLPDGTDIKHSDNDDYDDDKLEF
jgi:hypothetical protein